MATRWRPALVPYHSEHKRPAVGDVVGIDWRAWEVMHVEDAIPTADEEQKLALYVEPYRSSRGPYRVTLRRLHGEPSEHENDRHEVAYRAGVSITAGFSIYPNARVPLCSCHSHPWPCRESVEQETAEKALAAAERELQLMPGCCPTCEEPVTSRQRSITFGGPNVRNPLAEGPTFHLRRKCRHGARAYEELWVAAEPGRSRSLLTLRCQGTVIVHGDGSAECFGAAGSDCPSVYADHRCAMACYIQSHGCGRGCSSAGHPGTHIDGYPEDPRAVTRPEGAA